MFLFESEDLRKENRTKIVLFGLVDSYVKIPEFSTAIPIFMNPTVFIPGSQMHKMTYITAQKLTTKKPTINDRVDQLLGY